MSTYRKSGRRSWEGLLAAHEGAIAVAARLERLVVERDTLADRVCGSFARIDWLRDEEKRRRLLAGERKAHLIAADHHDIYVGELAELKELLDDIDTHAERLRRDACSRVEVPRVQRARSSEAAENVEQFETELEEVASDQAAVAERLEREIARLRYMDEGCRKQPQIRQLIDFRTSEETIRRVVSTHTTLARGAERELRWSSLPWATKEKLLSLLVIISAIAILVTATSC